MSKYETAVLLEGGLGATIHGKTLKETLEIIDLNDAYNYMMELATKKQPLTTTVIRDLNRISTLETMQPKTDAGNIGQLKFSHTVPPIIPMHHP
ncbi:hypothetical protein [Bombilactobacillus bombi]|uniref:hypothetical protein n=1 Tax=Bombilactobacillus bombi TaxID=1303590 RepID=UPI002159D374|nr:hypothetical protein [Bombilactobacillus bombi]